MGRGVLLGAGVSGLLHFSRKYKRREARCTRVYGLKWVGRRNFTENRDPE